MTKVCDYNPQTRQVEAPSEPTGSCGFISWGRLTKLLRMTQTDLEEEITRLYIDDLGVHFKLEPK